MSNKPTIPTVNNATLKIQKNGTTVKTFTANASSDVTCNITVPTKTSELSNDSGFLTSSGSCNYANSAGTASSATTSGAVSTVVDNGSTKDLVYALTDTDAFRIRYGGFNNDSWVEIATSDDGNEPIYVRQYSWDGNTPGSFENIVRTLTLLDESGNTQFPGTVTATTFTGNLTGNCSGSAGSVAWNNVSGKPTIPTNTNELTNGAGFITADYAFPKSGGELRGTKIKRSSNADHIEITGGTDYGSGPSLVLTPYNSTEGWQAQGTFVLHTNAHNLIGYPNGTLTWDNKNIAMAEDVIPRSGGAVIIGNAIGRISDDGFLRLDGGTGFDKGSSITLHGKDLSNPVDKGKIYIHTSNGSAGCDMMIYADGTWTWSGQPCQTASDQRLKQQITQIDTKLLDAWEDVEPCQFKYNDAVSQKKDKARLHTGYVVQQINEACKSHNLDISAYGLYCHEEYPERTEEVEVKQDDGSIKKETRVIEEASEHYSLRYTETLVVECAYLRRENARLKERLQQHDNYFSNIEKRLQSLENS